MAKHLGGGDGIRDQKPGMRGRAAPHRPQRPDPTPPSGPTPPPAPLGGAPGPDLAGPLTDRLRYLDAATRRIARGMNLDETLWE
ncbi:serine/threonine protein phosphatase, partial [Streptomyces sp. WAC 05379]